MKWDWRKQPDQEAAAVVRFRPSSFAEASDIATGLAEGKLVILDTGGLAVGEGQRVIDFLCGAVFLAAGQVVHLSQNIYLLLPCDVTYTDSLLDAAEDGEEEPAPEGEAPAEEGSEACKQAGDTPPQP